MLTEQMQEFYASVGYPLERLVRKAPIGIKEQAIIRAAEEIFDRLYCYELIEIPSKIFNLADTYDNGRDYAKEQAELKSAEYWRKKAEIYKNGFISILIMIGLMIFIIGDYYG